MAPVLMVILLATLTRAAKATTYYNIVPINSTDLCDNYPNGTCYTLDNLPSRLIEYVADPHNRPNVTLTFSPGEHTLTRNLTIFGAMDITLTREQHNNSNTSSKISCVDTTGFRFQGMQLLTIEGLEISTCNRETDFDWFGGIMYVVAANSVYIRGCQFINNHVTVNSIAGGGGAVFVRAVKNVSIIQCQFIGNRASTGHDFAPYGGAINIHEVKNTTISNCRFIGNVVTETGLGGAISVYGGTSFDDPAYSGDTISIRFCQFNGNQATGGGGGGAIYVSAIEQVQVLSSGNVYTYNTAGRQGGAIYGLHTIALFNNDSFSYNVADNGAAIYIDSKHDNQIRNCNFQNNEHEIGGYGVVAVREAALIISDDIFVNNRGSLHTFNSQVAFNGTTKFSSNSDVTGGAITSIASEITINKPSQVTISGNIGTFGGGLFLDQSTMNTFGSIIISDNTAISGGGIYAIRSTIEFRGEKARYILDLPDFQHTDIANNAAYSHGGGLYLIASTVKISNSYVSIRSNTANQNGGGTFLEQTAKIEVIKQAREYRNRLTVRLEFNSNTAQYGGAVYVSDSSNAGVLCERDTFYEQINLSSQQCFFQTLQLGNNYYGEYLINTFFLNNTARLTGGDIYGGLLDRCKISSLAEIRSSPQYVSSLTTGIDYLNATVNFDWAKGYIINTTDFSYHVSSGAVRVCFCTWKVINCNNSQPTVYVKKGETFSVSIVAVDQIKNKVSATVISSLIFEDGEIGRLKEGEERQPIGKQCTDLQYNAYSTGNTAKIQVTAEGPCSNQGISKREFNVVFLPCDCAVGFQQLPPQIDCICDCDVRLKPYLSNCSSADETIQVVANVWIEYVNSTNQSGFVIHDCLFDYCVDKPANISLISSGGASMQCAFNRTGTLCGKCEKDLSLMFASSRCEKCSNYFLFLLLPFALAGIALVTIILFFNITVATGTINGLIFYANILAANRPIFLPFSTPNALTVFISWINLDLGIETCFYDGMDSYGKLLLQLVFPSYLIFLIAIIILLCERSQRISKLLGKGNPVATLCTLILLSYSKLVRTIISALQSTTLVYPDGSHETVWLLDANVPYFTTSHIPRFLAAALIIILGAVYTVLLLFGQTFYYCSHNRIMKWVSHPKYDSFIKEYHAPLAPKHRYWVGLSLFARIIHYLISAFSSDSIIILSAGMLALGLILLKHRNQRIYKSWPIDTLETSFLVNLVVLTIATFYVKAEQKDQQTLAYTSMTVSFVTLLGIVVYHSFGKCITSIKQIKRKVQDAFNRRRLHLQAVPNEDSDSENNSDEDEHYFETTELVEYTARNTDRCDSPPMDTYHTQPIIRHAVCDDQLREPALDDLVPVQPEDYNVLAAPRPHRQQETTYTVVDIRDDQGIL